MADDLTKSATGTLAKRESFIQKGDLSGTEDIQANELRLPRLAIAQGLSSQIIPDGSDYIKGLSMYDLFNDLTGTVYGRGPIKFVVTKRETRRVEFDPENRGVPLDLNVPMGDPRTEWTSNPDTGEREAPRATKFTEFVILVLMPGKDPEPIVMSIKDTNKWNRRASERLTGFLKFHPPIYSTYYSVESKSEKNDQGTFGVYVIKQVAKLDDPDQTDEQWEESLRIFNLAKEFRESLVGKTIVVEREVADEDSDDFEIDENGEVRT
jgi:hypothetical protein